MPLAKLQVKERGEEAGDNWQVDKRPGVHVADDQTLDVQSAAVVDSKTGSKVGWHVHHKHHRHHWHHRHHRWHVHHRHHRHHWHHRHHRHHWHHRHHRHHWHINIIK